MGYITFNTVKTHWKDTPPPKLGWATVEHWCDPENYNVQTLENYYGAVLVGNGPGRKIYSILIEKLESYQRDVGCNVYLVDSVSYHDSRFLTDDLRHFDPPQFRDLRTQKSNKTTCQCSLWSPCRCGVFAAEMAAQGKIYNQPLGLWVKA